MKSLKFNIYIDSRYECIDVINGASFRWYSWCNIRFSAEYENVFAKTFSYKLYNS